jgi:uncharacterized heparinase superfamily protein
VRKGLKDISLHAGMVQLKMRRLLVLAGILPVTFPRQAPKDPWLGKPLDGRNILTGEFTFHGDTFRLNQDSWRKIEQMDVAWQRELNGFGWLRDVMAFHDDTIEAAKIRQFIQGWWRQQLHRQPVGRHPDILGERVAQWLCHRDFLLRGANQIFKRRFYKQLYSGLIKLERARQRKQSRSSFTLLKGLIFGALTLPSAHSLLAPVLGTLRQAMAARFLADGGHVSRSPQWHLEEIKTLMEIRLLLDTRKIANIQPIDDALFKMLSVLATLTHPDGNVALFNDSLEVSTREVNRLWQAWRKPQPKPENFLPEMKFVRLQQAASVLIMDAGILNHAISRSFYGTLGFEFSSEEERLFVNCGGYRGSDLEWRRACKSTAAHSTLSIDNANSWQAPEDAQYTFVFQHDVSCQLDQQEESITVDAAYNGYAPYAGMVHYRKLTLSAEGRCLQGVDILTPHKSLVLRSTHRVQIRFHLAPQVEINRISRGSIELKTAGGQIWRFHSPKEFAAGVEESVYLGKEGKPVKSMQISIETLISGQKDMRVDWELKRV